MLSLGGEEAIATIGADGKVTFANPEHLTQLTEADLLSLRLYLNGDAGNVLWEYAFEHVVLTPNPAGVKELFVTADDNELAFNLMYMGYSSKDLKDRDIKKVKWKIDNAIGTFSPASNVGRTGSFSTTLTTVRRAGAEGYLYAEGDDSSGASSIKGPKVTVLAGKPASIDVQSTGKTAIGGIDEITLEITVEDSYPQPVEDGTSVGIEYFGNLDVEYSGTTVDGKVQVKIKGASQTGVIPLTIYSGGINIQHNVTVDDIQLAISMDTTIEPYARETVRISAISEGHNLEGKTLSLRSTKGSLREQIVVIRDGVAETLLVADSAIGSGLISASFEDLVYAQQNFEVDYRTAIIGIDEPVLVADQATNGTVTVDNGFGTNIDVPYVTSTEVTVTGKVGTTEKLSIGGLENPPIEPLLYYNLNRVYGDNTVGDAYGVINATIGNVARDLESFDGFKGSYAFAADSNLKIPHHNALQKDNRIGFGLKVKPIAAGVIVDYSATSQKLTLLPNNKIQYQVETSEGLYTVESSPIELDEWNSIGVRYDNGELALEVNDEKFTAIGAGALLTSTSGDSAATIGGDFVGSINEFKIIDWDYPLLATLPNGGIEMDVVFNSTTEKVVISSTNKMGTRPMGYLASNPFNSPFHNALNNQLFPQAYAGERFNRFLGQVKMQRQAVTYALVETGKWALVSSIGFSNGVIYGDTSTTAGIIGDIALGFMPFGDVRDIAIQEYYYVYNTLDNNGKPKYDETILYLAYIGLGADALMLSPAAPLGIALNGAVAGTKTGMKLLDKLPGKKVLAQRFKEMAEAARDRDWTRFEAITRNTLPFMQLFAAVALDEDLRNLLGSAIRSTADLDNWAKYLKGYADQPDAVAHISPLPKGMFDEAYAAGPTSSFKAMLIIVTNYGRRHNIDTDVLGGRLSDAIGSLRKSIDDNTAMAKYAYKEDAIQAMVNIRTMGRGAVDKLRYFKNVSAGMSELNGDTYKRINEMMLAIKEINFQTLISIDEGKGIGKVIDSLSNSAGNFAKGGAFQLIAINAAQKAGKVISGIEESVTVSITVGGRAKAIRNRFYDYVEGVAPNRIFVETKAWLPQNVRGNVKNYLVGKNVNKTGDMAGNEGAQLMTDLLSWRDNGFSGHRWELDHDSVDVFKDELIKQLKTNTEVRKHMQNVLEIADKNEFKNTIAEIVKRIKNSDEFVVAVLK